MQQGTSNNEVLSIQNYENSSLCFSKDYFYAPNFDVDTFLTRYKREYGLERLNQDLAIYLKLLKSSMIDLINKDYADFVNLSTNLVGLDKAINDLKKPLIAIQADVENIQNVIDNESSTLLAKINEKLSIEKRRIVLKLLMNWQRSLKVTHEMISNDANSQKLTGDYIERIAFEFRQLKHSLTFCQKEMTQNNDINKLSLILEKTLQELFIKSYDTNDTEQLIHVLKSYVLLSKQQSIELLYQENYVKPYMNQYICDAYLETNEFKLDGVYNKILSFIDDNKHFLRLTSEIKCSALNATDASSTSEFNFLINSIWSYVVEAIDLNLNQIFSPVDPNQFHKRYSSTIKFLKEFEVKCQQQLNLSIQRLRLSKSYKYFLRKWPINIYYQIRFQEISFKFEQNLNFDLLINEINLFNLSADDVSNETGYLFHLKITNILYESLNYSWNNECFLNCLMSSFWKLNLQLISRYENYFKAIVVDKFVVISNEPSTVEQSPQVSQQQQFPVQSQQQWSDGDIKFLVLLMSDVNKLCDRLPNFFDGNVAPLMRACGVKEIAFLKEALTASITKLHELIAIINERVINIIAQQASVHLKSANEIPRLYRRTNRELTKTASGYVNSTIQILSDFNAMYGKLIDSTIVNNYLRKMIDQLCQKYYSIASDLLTSVQKMEDSLKRLKRVRGDNKAQTSDSTTSSATNTATGTTTSNVMSDDDKIRFQLYIDVCEFGSSLLEKFSYQGDENYAKLYKLVEEVKNKIES